MFPIFDDSSFLFKEKNEEIYGVIIKSALCLTAL